MTTRWKDVWAARMLDARREVGDDRIRASSAAFAELLGKLYLVAVSHARSTGWADSKAGRRRRT